MLSLAKFYKANEQSANQIIPVIEGRHDISLRLIDWFVTNYAKKHGTVLSCQNSDQHINIYMSYRLQLKAYSKQLFDPFRRRDRILFYFTKDEHVETTIGQLNFFRWILQNNILEYISKNKTIIDEDMILSQKDNANRSNETSNSTKRKKRHEISKNFSQNLNTFVGKTLVTFD